MKSVLIPIMLLLAGFLFLLPTIASRMGGRFNLSGRHKMISLVAGVVLFLATVCLYLFIPAGENDIKPGVPTILGVTIRKNQANGVVVYDQRINFSDEDGNTDRVEWELVDLSDPSQKQYIQFPDNVVDAPPEVQKIRATITSAWYCEGHTYVAIVAVSLVDRDGNRSKPVRYTIDCQ